MRMLVFLAGVIAASGILMSPRVCAQRPFNASGDVQRAFARTIPRPAVAIVIDPNGRPLDARGRSLDVKLAHWKSDLTNAVEAHASVGQPVVIYYQSQDAELAAKIEEFIQASRMNRTDVTAVPFTTGAEARSLLESWITFHCTVDLTKRPMTPFAFLIVIGHGEMAERKDRCLRCGQDVVNISQLERKCSKSHFPLISVLHMCALNSLRKPGEEVADTEVPVVPIKEITEGEVERFALDGVSIGGGLPTDWANTENEEDEDGKVEDIVYRIASAPPGVMAISDGLFFKTYREAFALNSKRQFIQNLKGRVGENQNLRLVHLKNRMSLAATNPGGDGKQRRYEIGANRSALTPSHIIASTNPEYVFLAPAVSMLENFEPARDIAPDMFDGMSFRTEKGNRRVIIRGTGQPLNRPYGAVNCQQLLSGEIDLGGKVLFIEMVSASDMRLSFRRNDPKNPSQTQFMSTVDLSQPGLGVLHACELKSGIVKRYRVTPPDGYFVSGDASYGLALSPVDAYLAPNNRGWGARDQLWIGPILLADSNDVRGETIDNWKTWEESQLSIPLNERWIPQRWWRSSDSVTLEYFPGDWSARKPMEFVVDNEALVGVGGPVVYPPEIVLDGTATGRKFGLSVDLSFKRVTPASNKSVASILLLSNAQVVGNLRLEKTGAKGDIRGFVPLLPEQAVNYLIVVIHGKGRIELRDLQLGWTKVAF